MNKFNGILILTKKISCSTGSRWSNILVLTLRMVSIVSWPHANSARISVLSRPLSSVDISVNENLPGLAENYLWNKILNNIC